ncbi:MAG: ABC transporter ATP-binding protein/permease [Lentisphaeria bacterium]|nr:ABC transporter ATP-binding protein/permease [Lentisphaeria bacterium]
MSLLFYLKKIYMNNNMLSEPDQLKGWKFFKNIYQQGWRIISPAKSFFILTLILSSLSSFILVFIPVLLAKIIDGLSQGDHSSLNKNTYLLLVLAITSIIIQFIYKLTSEKFTTLVGVHLQTKLHDKMLSLSQSYHRNNNLGKLCSVISMNAMGAQQMFCALYRSTILLPVELFIGMIAIFTAIGKNPQMQGVTLTIISVTGLGLFFIGQWLKTKLGESQRNVQRCRFAENEEVLNSLQAPVEMQLMGATQIRSKKYQTTIENSAQVRIKASYYRNVNNIIEGSAVIFLQALFIFSFVILFGGVSNSSAGALAAVILIIPKVLEPIQKTIAFFTGIHMSWPEASEVVTVLDQQSDTDEGNQIEQFKNNKIILNQVNFAYDESKKVLDNFSCTFESGKRIAVCARSGEGKSTILNLLMKTQQPQSGHIIIGDEDIAYISATSLRKKVIRLSQFPAFVSGTIKENFQLIKQDVMDSEIQSTCEKMDLWQLMCERAEVENCSPFELKLQREASSDSWSGGQRKRFALARGLLTQPYILLIDEIDSGLSPIDSKKIAELLSSEVFEGVTILLVTHTPAFAMEVAEEIVCIQGGKLVAQGSPTELIKVKDNLFYEMYTAFAKTDHFLNHVKEFKSQISGLSKEELNHLLEADEVQELLAILNSPIRSTYHQGTGASQGVPPQGRLSK